ncbi:MAG TPA: class III extradiol ring-cleavage dioxygenase [Micropepsaceae bacterium]|jgi:4,5-DOPA dioxygenase extradiol|nr:class III extradiol ring-cleavage dioxygenase [Micropepsaceae bacterium]
MVPSVFVSHGAPTLPLDECPARTFLKGLGATLPRPSAVLAVSAHWETETPTVNLVSVNDTIHDFSGFPDALYEMRYPAHGSRALVTRTQQVLAEAGFKLEVDEARGLDHGAWVPLMLMYPEADVPVVQLSVQSDLGPEYHMKLGAALAPLRSEDVLVLGTGGFVHNLWSRDRGRIDGPEPPWVPEFSDWVHAAITHGRTADLVRYLKLAPHAALAHPEEEHFLPLFVALGAGGVAAKPERLHESTTFGTLRMDAYAFT